MPSVSEAMEESELVALLADRIDAAMNDSDGEISAARQKSLGYYLGEPYGNEREGHSQYRSREVLETVEWCLPALLRIFTAGDRVVVFDPVGRGDEPQAEQETDAVNHALLAGGDYFMSVYCWLKSALLEPVAYLKVWMDQERTVKGEEYAGLTAVELASLTQDPEVEITRQRVTETVDPTGAPLELFDVKLKRSCVTPKLRVEPLPGEETLIDAGHTKLALDDCAFVCHRTRKTFSWLVNAGYDRALLEEISPNAGESFGGERANRLFTTDETWSETADASDASLRTFWVHECSVLVDFDGDGVAERRQIVMIGDRIFANEEYDYVPIVPLCAIPMPHRHPGLAEADLVKDLQLLKSTLIRQLLDNIYRVNKPKRRVGSAALTDDGRTIASLLDPLADFIPCEDPSAIMDDAQTSFIGELMPAIQFFTDSGQTRTGIAPNLSLDPAVLQKSTMGAFTGALEQASQRVELLARIFAESGFKWLAQKVHRLLKEHSQRPIMLQMRGQWVEVNPADWRERTNVSANVGLGFNDKTKEMLAAQALLQVQMQLMPAGIVKPENLLATAADLVQAAGKKGPERYFSAPQPPHPPAPDPALVLAQAQAQAMGLDAQAKMLRAQTEQAAAQLEAQVRQHELSVKAREDEVRLQIQQLEAQVKLAESQAKVANTQADTALKDAQRQKALADAREQQMDNEAVESGLIAVLESTHVAPQTSPRPQ
jgi:hypothetical protein